jgi:predicted DNA-binding transcriptional regulator AlpA
MNGNEAAKILSIREVGDRLGQISPSSVYKMVTKECLPNPVQLPIQRSGWPSREIQLIVDAVAIDLSESEIKEIVRGIQERREAANKGHAK